MKTGYKTTEFWLSLLAMLLGTLMSSGLLAAGGLAAQIIGGAMGLLGALGYTASRTSVKNKEAAKTIAKHLSAITGNPETSGSGELSPLSVAPTD